MTELNIYDCAKGVMNSDDLAVFSLAEINSVGYVVLRNFDVDVFDVSGAGGLFHQFCNKLGHPISHDSRGSIIWDIKTNPNSISQIKTYSEHSSEAQMHTDSQYSHNPEEYFGLLSLKKADCGGGLSMLLTLKDILKDLRAVDESGRLEKTLRNTDYPFIVPNVFKKSEVAGSEFNFGPILRDNEIRFRVDTFEKAIEERPDLCSSEQLTAYKSLKNIVLSSASIKTFHLEPKDLILVNNRTILHGRTEFKDDKRHLLRIRFNASQA